MASSSTKTKAPGVYRRGKGFAYVVSLGRDPAAGRRRQKWVGGFATLGEAKAARSRAVADLERNTYVPPSKLTLAEFVEEQWLPAQRTRVRQGTLDLYRQDWRRVKPRLGNVQLRSINAARLQSLYADLLAFGNKNGGPLGARSVQILHAFLHRCFVDAVRWGMLERNPADLVDRPSAPRPEIRAWTPQQVRAFLVYTSDDRLAPLWRLLATTGLRRGEALGLRWTDLDLDNPRLSVQQSLLEFRNGEAIFGEPKTANARRLIDLDAETAASLRRWRARLAEEQLAAGPFWHHAELVFVDEIGRPLNPETVSKVFRRLETQAGLPHIKLHGLRHSHATAMLAAGISPKVAQERLGHFSVSLILDTYSHTIAGMQAEAARRVADLIDG